MKKHYSFGGVTQSNQSLVSKENLIESLKIEGGEPALIDGLLEKMKGKKIKIVLKKGGVLTGFFDRKSDNFLFLSDERWAEVEQIERIEVVQEVKNFRILPF